MFALFRASRSRADDFDDDCESASRLATGNPLTAAWLLFKTLIGGGEEITDCLEGSPRVPVAAPALMTLYNVLSIVLLLNLLIWLARDVSVLFSCCVVMD